MSLESPYETRFVLGPNASLTHRGALVFMGLISVATLGVAAWCTAHGFWPVLPFAGLELGCLYWALVVSMRSGRYREIVSFEREVVRVSTGLAGTKCFSTIELSRSWSRCWLEPGKFRNDPCSLVLGCSGRNISIGRCLTDRERETLAARFKVLLSMRPPESTGEAEWRDGRIKTLGDA